MSFCSMWVSDNKIINAFTTFKYWCYLSVQKFITVILLIYVQCDNTARLMNMSFRSMWVVRLLPQTRTQL